MTDLAKTLAALSEAATQDSPWFYGDPDVGLAPEPFFGKPLEGGMHPLQPMTRQDAEFVVALWAAYRTGQLVPVPSVETVADAIEACMGPLVGSPEYLADPVKCARAEKRRRDGAVTYATAVITAMKGEK